MCKEVINSINQNRELTNVLYAELTRDVIWGDIDNLISHLKDTGNPLELRDINRLRLIKKQIDELEILTDRNYGIK